MPDETIQARLDAIEQALSQATDALDTCRTDEQINRRIETANAREIEKLKRHVAKLQRDAATLNTGTPVDPTLRN